MFAATVVRLGDGDEIGVAMSASQSLHELFEGSGRECSLGHEALLTLARKVQAAAEDADPGRLAGAVRRFAEGLVCHVRADSSSFVAAAPPESRILDRGNARLLRVTEELLADAEHGCTQVTQQCKERADEIVALLTLQIDGEGNAGRRRGGTISAA
jgi:hypothetical protein